MVMTGSLSSVDATVAAAFAAARFALMSGLFLRRRLPVMVFWSSRLCSLRSCSRRCDGVGFLADFIVTTVLRAANSAKLYCFAASRPSTASLSFLMRNGLVLPMRSVVVSGVCFTIFVLAGRMSHTLSRDLRPIPAPCFPR